MGKIEIVIYYNITAFTVLLIIFTVSIGDLLQIHLKKNYIKVIKQKIYISTILQ